MMMLRHLIYEMRQGSLVILEWLGESDGSQDSKTLIYT